MTNVVNVATIVLTVIASMGAIAGLIAWFYRRGGQERSYAEALDRNTKANNDVAKALADFKTTVLDMFHDMDKRITRLEDKSVTVSIHTGDKG